MTEQPERKVGRPPGTPNPNAGKRRTLPGSKKKLTLDIEPDLYQWIKTHPPGFAESVLRKAEIESRFL